jgi:hypothetical protein
VATVDQVGVSPAKADDVDLIIAAEVVQAVLSVAGPVVATAEEQAQAVPQVVHEISKFDTVCVFYLVDRTPGG